MTDSLIQDAAERLFADLSTTEVVNAAEEGTWPAALWRAVEESGFLDVLASGEGAGVEALPDACTIFRAAGRNAAPIPLVETTLARWVLSGAGLDLAEGPVTLAPVEWHDQVIIEREGRVSGSLSNVAWGRSSKLLVIGQKKIALVSQGQAEPGLSFAGEPRDQLTLRSVPARTADLPEHIDRELVFRLGALGRAAQMAGAMEAVLALAVEYAGTRIQFGRPLAKFQVIQHQLAILGEHVAAAGVAVEAAAEEVARGGDAGLAIAAAKIRAGEAAGKVAEIAHQVHGAIGFTHEHRLHHFTRRLWAWRDEFGTESDWALGLGKRIGEAGSEALWPMIVGA
jgi:alkylation response protein AidB-like acyl-CoA dehydrogenase